MQRDQRLKRELSKMNIKPPSGISVSQKDDKINFLQAAILGPDDTPYKNGTFHVEISIPDNYPFSPPSMRFLTKIYHPNIDDNGRICLDLIKMPPKGSWKPSISLEGLLIAVRMLLQYPNPDDPLMADIAEEFKNNKSEYERKAQEYTNKYA